MEELEFEGHRIGTRWKHLERERGALIYIYAESLKRGNMYIKARKLVHSQFWLWCNGQEYHARTTYSPDDEVVIVGAVDNECRRQIRLYMARRVYRPRLTFEL